MGASREQILTFYRRPAAMSDLGRFASLPDGLPGSLADLVGVVQGLLLHQHVGPSYGVSISEARLAQVHTRPVEAMLGILAADGGPAPPAARPLDQRLIGNCRHFSLLLTALLRAKGAPARARCGFGDYFEPGRYVDHWVCEYWNGERWVLVDAQIDAHQQALFRTDFDLQDVPRDRFLVAGEAWRRCRAGEADPAAFGILDMSGLWFVSGNVVRDFAALNNMEMLPWDAWGAMGRPDAPMTQDELGFIDRVAAITLDADARFDEMRELYEADERLKVPPAVFNVVLNRLDAL